MGPTVTLDKSAFQSLSERDTSELSRYFYVVIPPVLVLEILADLKKPKLDAREARSKVMQLARKVHPVDSWVNVDHRVLCVGDLLGAKVQMDRKPIIAGGRKVPMKDGTFGILFDEQPEMAALTRWSTGEFDGAEQLLAIAWRAASKSVDLAGIRKMLRGRVRWLTPESPVVLRQAADEIMADPKRQFAQLAGLLVELGTPMKVAEAVVQRWRAGKHESLHDFAPYAAHCIRVRLLFQMALVYDLVGTRSTNRIDMEYLYYMPFAHIFCSGDKFHRTMAAIAMGSNQSFVWHEDLRKSLRAMSDARKLAKESGAENWHGLLPEEGSLIRTLWTKHTGRVPELETEKRRPPAGDRGLPKKIQEIIDACKQAEKDAPPTPRWPCG